MKTLCGIKRVACVVLAIALGRTTLAQTDAAGSASAAVDEQLAEQAVAHERVGAKLKAAETYEKIVRADPAKRALLALRLSRLYAECAATNQALAWAREVMKTNPDPQAFLAGIYSALGDQTAAQGILETELKANKESRRGLTLRWQLAEAYEKQGEPAKAEKTLEESVEAVKGTPDENAAKMRLQKFKDKKEGKKDSDTPPPADDKK